MRLSITSVPLAALLALFTAGCSAFLPAHINSYSIRGEHVQVTMLTWEQMTDFQRDYLAVFKSQGHLVVPKPTQPGAFVAAAPLAAAAVGFAIDYVKKRLDEEATLYEAQFSQRIAADGFWIRKSASDRWQQNYHGFKVTRYVEGKAEPAYLLVCGMAVSEDGRMLQVAPLYFVTQKAKAKVLAKRGWSFLWDWALNTGDEIESHTDISIDAVYVNDDGKVETIALASFPIDIGHYPLSPDANAYRILRKSPDSGQGLLETAPAGWFGGVPISANIGDDRTQAGTFWIGATVTEKDPSNAKRYLEAASKAIEGQRESIIKIVTEKVK
jgi:hypothetical protein